MRGCTINDLLIAAVTAGVRDLLSRRGENQDGLELLASVPVGVRGGSEAGMFIAPLPVGVPDAAERLNIITKATAADNNMPDLPVLAAGARAAFEGYINGGGHASEA
jgi:hypothetical protein